MIVVVILLGIAMYIIGQLWRKEFKYAMGVPIGLLLALKSGTMTPLWLILTYFIACEIGYGDNNPLTHIVGKRNAITIHGIACGLACFPVLGVLAILAGLIAGISFWVIAKYDDEEVIKEPYVAILRGITIMLWYVFI